LQQPVCGFIIGNWGALWPRSLQLTYQETKSMKRLLVLMMTCLAMILLPAFHAASQEPIKLGALYN